MKPKIGDMIYVPSSTYIFQYQREVNIAPKKYEKLLKPNSLLVIGESEDFYEIFREGVSWHVDKKDVYELCTEQR
jgi:hypothetical protein